MPIDVAVPIEVAQPVDGTLPGDAAQPVDGTLPGGRPLPGDPRAERRRLPGRTVRYWRVRALARGLPVVAVVGVGAATLDWFTPAIRWIIVGLLACYYLVIGAIIAPPIRRRIFWYAVSADEIDIQHGFIVTTRTVVPMNRVQHLKMERGPIADRFGVANLHIHTAAGSIPIHGLPSDEAEIMRERIGKLAGLADDV